MSETATAELLKKKTKKEPILVGDAAKQAAATTLFDAMSKEVQALDKDTAAQELENLLAAAVLNDFKMGGLMAQYQTHSSWWDGYGTFKEYVEAKVDIHYRKALYLIRIYQCLLDNNIPWETVQHIGWTRLKDLTAVITAENVNDWVAKAKVMTTLQLQEAIKAYLKEQSSGQEGPQTTSTVSTMTFKLHEDQKDQVRTALDKAKAELGTEYDTVALEGICTGYLGGSVSVSAESVSLTEVLKKHTHEEVLMAFEQVWPDIDLTIEV